MVKWPDFDEGCTFEENLILTSLAKFTPCEKLRPRDIASCTDDIKTGSGSDIDEDSPWEASTGSVIGDVDWSAGITWPAAGNTWSERLQSFKGQNPNEVILNVQRRTNRDLRIQNPTTNDWISFVIK
jgi:hypothetical protein